MSDKFVYVVSPDYLMPMVVESKMYSFYVKAYHNAKVAYDNLCKTNLSSVLGFILFYEELPDNLTYIIKFINFMNIIGTKDTLVILAVNDPEGVTDFLIPKLHVKNITFKYITGFEVVTDSFIRKSLYGSVVLHNYDPYVESIKPYKEVTSFNSNIALTPILSNDVVSILSPVVKLNNSENTIKHDLIMNSPSDSNLMLYMRMNYIKASFGEEIDEEGMLARIKALDGINTIVYKSIISIMKRLIVNSNLDRSSDVLEEMDRNSDNYSEPSIVLDLEETEVINQAVPIDEGIEDLIDSMTDSIKEELVDSIGDLVDVKEVIEPKQVEVVVNDDDYYATVFNYSEEDEIDDLDLEDDLNKLNI